MSAEKGRIVPYFRFFPFLFFFFVHSTLSGEVPLTPTRSTVYFGSNSAAKLEQMSSEDKQRIWKDPTKETWEKNPNLVYFREIAHSKTRSKELEKGFTIFFDTTCPLEYLNTEYDYYWDQKIYYLFQIRCAAGTPLGLLAVPSNEKGLLTVGKKDMSQFSPGERFLARLKFVGIRGDRAIWEEVMLYHE